MLKRDFAVKCEFCNNPTKNTSGRCHLHENMSAGSVRNLAFGTGLVPQGYSQSDTGTLYLLASDVLSDIISGSIYELDMSDGYGESYEEIASIAQAQKPNEGMLAFTTRQGATIFFLPEEYVDVRPKELAA